MPWTSGRNIVFQKNTHYWQILLFSSFFVPWSNKLICWIFSDATLPVRIEEWLDSNLGVSALHERILSLPHNSLGSKEFSQYEVSIFLYFKPLWNVKFLMLFGKQCNKVKGLHLSPHAWDQRHDFYHMMALVLEWAVPWPLTQCCTVGGAALWLHGAAAGHHVVFFCSACGHTVKPAHWTHCKKNSNGV